MDNDLIDDMLSEFYGMRRKHVIDITVRDVALERESARKNFAAMALLNAVTDNIALRRRI